MSGRRVSLRLAARRMRRERGRTLILLAALVVPLSVAVALATVRTTSILSPETRLASMIGQSQSVVHNSQLVRDRGPEQALADGPAALTDAAGRPVEADVEVTASLPARLGDLQVDSFGYGLDLGRAIHQGRFVTLEGAAPRTDGEVALSPAVASRLGAKIGDHVRLGTGTNPARVTGILALKTDTLRKFVVTTPLTTIRNSPGARAGQVPDELAPGQESLVLVWHLPVPVDADAMRATGWSVSNRLEALRLVQEGPNTGELTSWILGVTVLVLAELGLVLGAVYAIVVSSSRRELGLLASAGAGPKVRRAVISYQGALVGLAALVISIALGVGAAAVFAPYAAARSYEIWGSVRVDPVALAVLAVLGIGTPALAARIAARGIATDVVAALRDLPEPVELGRRRGLATMAGVLPMAAVLLIGGATLNSPLLVLLGALVLVAGAGIVLRRVLPFVGGGADRLPLLHRIGLRVTARAASRAAALGTVVASLATIAGIVLAAMGGLTEEVNKTYVPTTPSGSAYIYTTRMPSATAVHAMTDAFGVDRMVRLGLVSPPPPKPADGSPVPRFWGEFSARTPVSECLAGAGTLPPDLQRQPDDCAKATSFPPARSSVMAIEPADLDTLLGRAATAAERAGLAAGKAVVLDERLASGGVVTLDAPDPAADQQSGGQGISVQLPAVAAQARAAYRRMPVVLVGDAALNRIGAVIQPNEGHFYVPSMDGAVTEQQEDRANGILGSDIGQGTFQLEVERGPAAGRILRSTTIASIALIVMAAATLAFITVALATREMRTDLSALAAAGADRRFRSLLSGSHAGQVTLVGVLTGTVVTAVATPALLAAMDLGWSIWPWLGLLASSLAAVGAAVLAGWFGGSRITTMLKRAH